MKLGPLPVTVTVDTDESAFTLRHGKHELDLEVEDPLALLIQLGLLLVEAAPTRAPRKQARKKQRRKSKPGPRPVPPGGGVRCARDGCGKTFKQRTTPGRPKRFCGRPCMQKPRRHELGEALDRTPVEIPESASGMKARAKKLQQASA